MKCVRRNSSADFRPFKPGEWWAVTVELFPVMEDKAQVPLLYPSTNAMAVLAVALVGLPVVLMLVLMVLAHDTALAQAVAGTLSNSFVNEMFMEPIRFWYVIPLVVGFLIQILFKLEPTHLIISTDGLSIDRQDCLIPCNLLDVSWADLEKIYLPTSARKRANHIVCFKTKKGNVHEVKLANVLDVKTKAQLLSALQAHAPDVDCDLDFLDLLQPITQTTFTELWLNTLAASPERQRLAPLKEGTRLKNGDYKIEDTLGAGGQAVAYLAERKSTEENAKRLVIKEYVLPVRVTRSTKIKELEQMEKEAQLLGRLDHPQVVKLLDHFVEDHRGYMVFEFIEGQNLRSLVFEQGALPEDRVRDLFSQMCEILTYLHGRSPQVVHRDFTPDNLILTPSGRLILIDFNVALESSHTATSTVVGKQAYIPPEQFRGKAAIQSDLYAMGATLHFLLTGQDPEPLSSSHPQEILPGASARFDDVIAKLTELEPADRYESAQAAADALLTAGTTLKLPEHIAQQTVD